MKGSIVARRYARALFAVGKEKGTAELEGYGKDLAAIAGVLAASPELVKVFRNPIFSVEEKNGVAVKLMDKVGAGPMVRNFCFLLADKGRLEFLSEIDAVFAALLDAEKGVVRGELVTAVELAEGRRDELKAKLEQQTGKKLVLDFSSDKAILGGVVLKVGDMVMDASLRAQLNILKENIRRGE